MVSTGVTLRWLGLYALICLGLSRLSRKIALRPRVVAVSRGFRKAASILDMKNLGLPVEESDSGSMGQYRRAHASDTELRWTPPPGGL